MVENYEKKTDKQNLENFYYLKTYNRFKKTYIHTHIYKKTK